MAALSVTTTPQLVPAGWTDLQNLGTGPVYLGNDNTVSSSNGVRIDPNGAYTRPVGWAARGSSKAPKPVWIVAASGTQDVRTLS